MKFLSWISLCFQSIAMIAQDNSKRSWISNTTVYSQPYQADSAKSFQTESKAIIPKRMQKPELFTSGFIDIVNNGQFNASARLIRLFIGEQGKFALPVSFYSGVSANNFQSISGSFGQPRSNEQLINQFINPLSGMMNISTEDILFLGKGDQITRFAFIYHFGERVMTGFRAGQYPDPLAGRPVNFLNSFATIGLYFQTGAWDRQNSANEGICWMAARYHLCYSKASQLAGFLPGVETNGVYTGYSAGFGIDITHFVNLKLIYYKYLKEPELDYSMPIYQFSFNYAVR